MSIISQLELEALLPHSGAMCLLEQVSHWDEHSITCRSHSHRFEDNPLRNTDCLPVEAGIEYAAQAMAIHGALQAREQAPGAEPRVGYLAVLSKVEWRVQRLDDLAAELEISARCLAATATGSHYQFNVTAAGQTLISGQALVALAPQD